jgi:hypothetical protein
MTLLGARARSYLGDAFRSFERAPVEVALAFFIATGFSAALEIGGEAMRTWTEVAASALLVLAFAWTGTMLQALGVWRPLTRWLVTLGGLVLVVLYDVLLLDFERQAEVWRALALLAAAALWLFAVPALGGGSVERMRRVDGRVILRTLAVGLYGVALFAGLALALAAIDTLFELDLEGEIYGHVFGWIFFVLVPWVVFGGLDDYVRPAEGPEIVAGAVHRLTLFLVPPLLAVYFLILYAYVVRILATGEIPKNLVSPLVLAAAALAALALLLFDPQPERPGFSRALRLAPPLLLPLVPLGVWALLLRIGQYGWTEVRALRLVLLAAFTGLALLATSQLVRRRPFDLHALPVALAVALVLAVLAPWNVIGAARASQQQRLAAALDSIALYPIGPAPAVPRPARTRYAVWSDSVRTVPATLYDRVATDARYLHAHFGPDALPAALAGHARDAADGWVDFAGVLGLARESGEPGPDGFVNRRLAEGFPVPLGGGTLYRLEYQEAREHRPGEARVTADSLRIRIHLPGHELYADLAQVATGGGRAGAELAPAASVLQVRDSAGSVAGELVVFELGVNARSLQHLSAVLVLTSGR